MNHSVSTAGARSRLGGFAGLVNGTSLRRGALAVVGLLVVGAGAAWYWQRGEGPVEDGASEVAKPAAPVESAASAEHVSLSSEQQKAIGLMTEKVTTGASAEVLTAPGRVAPNEAQYAYITPRAGGVVRSVTAHVGQDVKAGDLLATIDSPEVGEARLELYTRLQILDVAQAQATWQEKIHATTIELIGRLQKGETPDQIHNAFTERAVGENREKLMTAYAQYRLAIATIDRNRDLISQKLITAKQFEKVKADYEVAQATYQSLMDQMGYENQLAYTRAEQSLKQAQTAVRAARERLRILGVNPDGTEPLIERGHVVGVDSDGTLVDSRAPASRDREAPDSILSSPTHSASVAVEPPGALTAKGTIAKHHTPISTYSIWAPFDGTILDRELIVPGVAVDTTHRIFTLANLSTVWVEANVQESDFNMLSRSRGGKVRFRSPAYPDREFEGEVIYSGDLVEEKSRSVKLLAKAENPDRLLKPGMFVEAEILSSRETVGTRIPTSALLTQGSSSYVYVRGGPELFDRRVVDAEAPRGDKVMIRGGLKDGDEIVVQGGYKLKAMTEQLTSSGG